MTESRCEHCDFTRFFFRAKIKETEMLQMPKYVAENLKHSTSVISFSSVKSQCAFLAFSHFTNFSSNYFFRLTDTSDEDKAKQPMTETEMLQIPKYVAENWLADQSQD